LKRVTTIFHFASVAEIEQSDTNAQLIQNSVTSYIKIKEERERKLRKKGKIINHMTERKRCQNRIAAFLCKAEWINETAPK